MFLTPPSPLFCVTSSMDGPEGGADGGGGGGAGECAAARAALLLHVHLLLHQRVQMRHPRRRHVPPLRRVHHDCE